MLCAPKVGAWCQLATRTHTNEEEHAAEAVLGKRGGFRGGMLLSAAVTDLDKLSMPRRVKILLGADVH